MTTDATAPSTDATSPAAIAGTGPLHEIETRGLVKTYGHRTVVNEVDLHIKAGEIVGFLGPNGAGKTTTFYMVVGLVAATRGQVLFNGRDITRLRMHQRARLGLGYLPQEPSTFRKLTVEQNILAIVEAVGVPRRERAARVNEQLEELHLTHVARQRAYTLSGGERRRLEIARALVTRPSFILMDEPFAAIDPISVADVQRIILRLKERGIGVIVTDHNVRETLRIVDRAYLIREGRVFKEGNSEFLINDPEARQFYLGQDFNM
ncbi:lipopolysaccharide ABC transporter ATP-binding protein [Opitutaceae bacterium TAV5]|nr:lipopolysaccharide ABC transporter ATP-binding protein [Opitutaceae bacterium TAV5]